MFKIEELSGSLIKSGRFKESIGPFILELDVALEKGVITRLEMIVLQREFCHLLLVPDAIEAKKLGDKMLALSLRMPPLPDSEFHENVRKCRKS